VALELCGSVTSFHLSGYQRVPRMQGLALSLDTLHRVLVRHGEQHLKRRS